MDGWCERVVQEGGEIIELGEKKVEEGMSKKNSEYTNSMRKYVSV